MNSQVHRFYRKFADEQAPIRLYHEVIGLHEAPHFSWEDIAQKAPSLPKGWYELSQLNSSDRIEFTRDYWLATLPFLPNVHEFIQQFFGSLDDIGVYLTQMRVDSPFECELVYSLRDESCFFHGLPPCSDAEVQQIKFEFQNILPEDYLAFLKIHNGFSKHTDTGILRTSDMSDVCKQIRDELEQILQELSSLGYNIDPLDLVPFYESFGQSSYQCFFAGWTPMEQPGNIYYSSGEKTLSDVRDRSAWQENLAFPTFLDWLIFYLESIE